jgi:two-component system chemotaxis response regulator CheY
MRVLIVEDNPTNRQLMLKMLSPLGECSEAVDGREAVHAFRQALDDKNPYDLICLDVMMPQMDGHEALAHIRQIEREHHIPDERSVKVIMTTAVHSPHSIAEAQQSGCNGYLVKPIRKVALYEELERLELIPGA